MKRPAFAARVARLQAIDRALADTLDALSFGPPVTHVYNPLRYAAALRTAWLERHATHTGGVLFVGLNPGPWGMAQTGVPFGAVPIVRDWLGLDGAVTPLANPHPKRPVEGLACAREEVSGARLWGLLRATFGTPERLFAEAFLTAWCPLAFMEASGLNRTPDKLPARERAPLAAACDQALAETIAVLAPRRVIGIGAFAEGRSRIAVKLAGCHETPVGGLLHPSPASPAANRDWAGGAAASLRSQGLDWPFPMAPASGIEGEP
jgi:single-strand selective monofunctional uracil DNA glycosylase